MRELVLLDDVRGVHCGVLPAAPGEDLIQPTKLPRALAKTGTFSRR